MVSDRNEPTTENLNWKQFASFSKKATAPIRLVGPARKVLRQVLIEEGYMLNKE